jgi:hypothetical protein
MLPNDRRARSTEALPTLLADSFTSAELLVELRLCEYAVASDATPQPRRERLLICEP